MAHIPVLLQEVSEQLGIKQNDIVLDGTINGGGHSAAFCSALGSDGHLIGIDMDADALIRARVRLKGCACRISLRQDNFRNLDTVLDELDVVHIDKSLFDLGMSSDQLDKSGRGFSFQRDEPLLMTFSPRPEESDITAREIVNEWAEESIADVLYGYGEERFARKIARRIVNARQERLIETTADLVRIVEESTPAWYRRRKSHPATRTFQALRIAVNDEIRSARDGIEKALTRTRIGGRVAVITFHSIEDRMAKLFFRDKKNAGVCTLVTKKPITPSVKEVSQNLRARSAKLRVVEKI